MSSKTSKNILFLNGAFDGHIQASIEVVKDLISLGHSVTCYVLDKYENRLKQTGAKLKIISVGKLVLPKTAPPIALNSMLMEGIYDFLLEDAKKSNDKYDYFFYDSFFDGKEINKFFNIPILVGIYPFPIGEMTPFIEKTAGGRNVRLNHVNKKYNLTIRDYLSMPYMSDAKYKLMLTSKLFHIESKIVDNSFYFIGPPLEERANDESFDFKKDPNKKLIYISLGTVFNLNVEFYKKCIETFVNSKEFQVIISIGQLINIKDLGKIPENINIFNYVPQLQILKQCDVFITHGGINSVNEGIYMNHLPLIVIPQEMDQIDNAKQIKKFEAGIFIDKDNFSSEILKNAIINILENKEKYKIGVEKIAESFKEARKGKSKIYEEIFA